MAYTNETKIAKVLQEHLATLVTSPATTFSWPGRASSSDKPRIEVQYVPNESRGYDLEDGVDIPGFLIATVVYEPNRGIFKALGIAQQIIEHFPTSMKLHAGDYVVRFINPAFVNGHATDTRELRVPVSIPFLASK